MKTSIKTMPIILLALTLPNLAMCRGTCKTPPAPSLFVHVPPKQIEDYQIGGLDLHNIIRNCHDGTPPVTLNDELNIMAIKCAEYYVKTLLKKPHTCPHLKHGWGENINPERVLVFNPVQTVFSAIEAFYAEYQKYNYTDSFPESEGFTIERFLKVGHFSQMLWNDTKEIGIGYAKGAPGTKSDDFRIVVVIYNGVGNVPDEFTTQVQPCTVRANGLFKTPPVVIRIASTKECSKELYDKMNEYVNRVG